VDPWKKSSFSHGNGQCVEAQHVNKVWQVRNTKDRWGTVVQFTEAEWSAFIAGVKAGEFDE
jgi:hypothetical protein